MAELDDKLLKNLDKTLASMNQRLQGLEQTLAGVKEGMVSAFNPAIIKSFTDSMRGLKAIRLIEADEAVKDIKKIKDEIDSLESKYKGEKPLKKGESLGSVREELSRYKALMREIDKGSEQRAIELANIRQKERDADLKAAEVVVSQREQAERRKAEIARAWAEQEAREKAQREKMKTASEKAAADERTAIAEAEAKKKAEIARAWAEQDRRRYEKDGDPLGEIAARKGLTGTLAALEDQTAVNEWRKQTAEEQKRIAKEEAEVEKQIKKEMAEEEKKLAAEEKQRYQDAVAANKAMTKAEDDLAEAKRKARTAESKAAYTEDTKQRIEEERKAARERAQQAKEVAAIQKKADAESMANQRRQIQIKSQLAAIDKNRISITKQSSDREKALAAQQQADYRSLQSELSKLIARQKELNAVSQGSGRRAKDRLSTYTISESEKAMRRYADAVRNAHREQKKLGDETNKMLPTLQRLASAFGVAFSVRGLAQFGKNLIKTRGEFEMQFVAMKQIIGDVDAATKIWNQTMQQALQSPFKAMQLVTYTKQLAAYRIETEKLFDTTKRLADVSAGLGVDMGRLILAYGQVKSANFLRASEVRQFTEAGVNIAGQLAEYFSQIEGRAVSTAEVMERITKRMVSFADVEEIFKRMTDEGGQFFKMQEIQTDTVKGQIQKLHDAYDQMLNTIGQANQGTIRNLVDKLNDLVRNWRNIVPLIKSSVTVLGSYIAFTKLAKMGVDRFGDSIVKFRLGKKKQTVEMQAAMVKETLLLNRQAKTITAWEYHTKKALFNVQMAWKALGSIMKSFAPFLAIEGVLYVYNKIMETRREEARLREDLANIRSENRSKADSDVGNYDKLIRRFNELNKGSIERKEIIDKLNSQYGKYLGFIVDETTAYGDLEKAQERVNLNIRERARLRAEEEAQQRIQEDYMQREAKLLSGKINPLGFGKAIYTFSYDNVKEKGISGEELEKFADYVKTQLPKVTEEVLKNRSELRKAVEEWLNTFYGITGANLEVYAGYDEKNDPFLDLFELYAEQELKIRDEAIKLSEEFKALPKQLQDDLLSMESEWSTAMQKLTKAGKGDEVEIPLLNVKLKVPTDLAEKSGVWEVIKEELNRRKEEFKIDLKLNAGLITEEQAEELRKQGKSTGIIFIDAVNKELADNILKDAGIEKSFEELKNDIFYNPQNIDDWDKVNHVIELITGNLISASDIVNGTTSYTKELANNLQVARDAINDAVKAQELVADGTQKEKEDAQKLVDKTIERYKWLLKIAKLLGLDTKAADEIVVEQGYDLSVGQFRLAAAQQAFMEKFGVASNTYGKQLSKIGVTDNLKDVADAYHKQSEELDVLIRNQETALENETNLTEEQKKNAQTTIENLKNEKSFAEFLATFFGYVPKKETTRKTHENASKLISLIKEMRSEYDKLSKSAYGYAKSEEKVREAYKDSVNEILGKAGITDYDFTTNEGMIQALEKVKTYATKLGKDAAAEVQKYIDQLETEIEINAQVRIREDFGKQMEKAFGDYELTLELDKLNLPKGLAADMWGIEETDLQDLRKKLSQMYMGLRDENGQLSDEAFKDYEKFLNKIDDLERKQQRERLKDYAKYLEAQYSERVKIEMDYVRKLAALEAETAIKEPQKREIREGLKREFLEKSRKQDWEDFKGSEFYVGMMEDLEKQGSASLEVMRKKLLEMRENAENLSPRALKEVVNALEKIDELEKKRIPPLKRIREEQEKLKGIEIKDVYERIAANQKKLAQDEQEQRELERMIMLEEERQKLEKQGITLEEAKARLAKSEQALSLILPSLDMRSDGSKDAEERRRIMSETVNQAKTEVEKWQEIVRILSGQFIIEGQEQGSKYRGLSLSDMKSRRDDAKKRIKDLEGVIGKDEELVKAQKDLADAWNDTWDVVKKWAQSVNGIFDGVMESVEYFTDETYGMVGAWKEFGDTSVLALTDLVSGIQAYQQANEEARKAGLATGLFTANGLQLAMVVLSVIIKVVQALSKLHDSRLDKEIQIQQERIDNLQRAYERLEKQIEKTWSTVSYIRTYREETQNLYEQYEALTNQINAEEAKKNTDKDKLQDYQDKQQEILDTLEEIKQQQIEVFGGIGEDSYRSAAEGFVDAWKSAFLETGDGLQGLQDHFDEFLNDWFVKQATMRIAASNLEPLFRKIDDAVDQNGVGGANVTWQELKEINDLKDVLLAQTNEQLQQLAGVFGLGGEGSLSGLAAGIQGMTEEQANILEAYWNSVRMYTANIDMNVTRIAQILGAGGDNANPMLAQMTLVAQNTNNINTLLQSVTKGGHSEGGSGIKVFVN